MGQHGRLITLGDTAIVLYGCDGAIADLVEDPAAAPATVFRDRSGKPRRTRQVA
jgi:hypothetical protein